MVGKPRGTRQQDDANTVVVHDLATLKALADPVRHTILTHLAKARTVKELALEMSKPADRLYYHLGLLERHGLVQATEARGEERRYVVTAGSIEIDPALTMPRAAADHFISTTLDQIRSEYAAATERAPAGDGKKRVMLALRHVRLDEAEREELMALLHDVTANYVDARLRRRSGPRANDGRKVYGVVAGIWPVDDSPDVAADGGKK